jgi:hypothetical protein
MLDARLKSYINSQFLISSVGKTQIITNPYIISWLNSQNITLPESVSITGFNPLNINLLPFIVEVMNRGYYLPCGNHNLYFKGTGSINYLLNKYERITRFLNKLIQLIKINNINPKILTGSNIETFGLDLEIPNAAFPSFFLYKPDPFTTNNSNGLIGILDKEDALVEFCMIQTLMIIFKIDNHFSFEEMVDFGLPLAVSVVINTSFSKELKQSYLEKLKENTRTIVNISIHFLEHFAKNQHLFDETISAQLIYVSHGSTRMHEKGSAKKRDVDYTENVEFFNNQENVKRIIKSWLNLLKIGFTYFPGSFHAGNTMKNPNIDFPFVDYGDMIPIYDLDADEIALLLSTWILNVNTLFYYIFQSKSKDQFIEILIHELSKDLPKNYSLNKIVIDILKEGFLNSSSG